MGDSANVSGPKRLNALPARSHSSFASEWQSVVRARLIGAGKALAKLVSRFLPRWTFTREEGSN